MKRFILFALALASCRQAVPETRHYRLVVPQAELPRITAPCGAAGPAALFVEDLDVDTAYDDSGIVYRDTPYRLDRYHYHLWISPPGRLVGDALGDGLAATGLFARVDRTWNREADAMIRGRVIAIEEIDAMDAIAVGRVAVELELVDADSERSLWKRRFDASHVIASETPDAVAAAVSAALGDIVREAAGPIATTLAAAACADWREHAPEGRP
jgi:uncharacterized lipoprotein YmbA